MLHMIADDQDYTSDATTDSERSDNEGYNTDTAHAITLQRWCNLLNVGLHDRDFSELVNWLTTAPDLLTTAQQTTFYVTLSPRLNHQPITALDRQEQPYLLPPEQTLFHQHNYNVVYSAFSDVPHNTPFRPCSLPMLIAWIGDTQYLLPLLQENDVAIFSQEEPDVSPLVIAAVREQVDMVEELIAILKEEISCVHQQRNHIRQARQAALICGCLDSADYLSQQLGLVTLTTPQHVPHSYLSEQMVANKCLS